MQIDKSLIEKFLENRCNAEEAKLVHRYLTRHPGILQQYYRYDWEEAATGDALEHGQAAAMYEAIGGRVHTGKTVVKRLISWTAAAAVIIVILATWLLRPAHTADDTPAPVATVTKPARQVTTSNSRQHQRNTTNTTVKITLPDGSIASLAPAAVISYPKAFEPGKREIVLEGQALFEVVKDKTRPFTVYSGNLSTTALGTSFSVTASPSAEQVQLLTGKVVVKAVKPSLAGWKKDIYLLPGQQMRYDPVASMVKVSGKGIDEQPRSAPAVAHDAGKQMVFDNTPLQQVFDKIAQQYKTTITYTTGDLKGMSFSGILFHNDSLPVILQAIARMNELSVTDVPGGFNIEKAPKE